MSTLRQIIDKVKFASRQFDEVTTAIEDIAIDEPEIDVTSVTPGISPGNSIEINDEVMLITKVEGNSVTVLRGYMGTPAASYLATQTIRVSPRNYRFEIFDAIKSEINSWPFSLYQTTELLVTADRGTSSYSVDMGYNVIQGISLDKETRSGWVRAYGKFTKPSLGDDTRVYFSLWDSEKSSMNYRIRAACKFDVERLQFLNQDMLLQAAGVPEQYEDIIHYGILWRLRFPKEEGRISDPPRGQTAITSPSAAMSTGGGFLSLRDKRIADEAAKLASLNGVRF